MSGPQLFPFIDAAISAIAIGIPGVFAALWAGARLSLFFSQRRNPPSSLR
jgi:hypothetical protein